MRIVVTERTKICRKSVKFLRFCLAVPMSEGLEMELVTVRDWLRYAVSRFGAAGLVYGHGTSNALDEAAYLILHTLHLPIDQLDPWLDARLLPAEAPGLAPR